MKNLFILLLLFFNCKTELCENTFSIGSVYINEKIEKNLEDTKLDFPISSFRIEEKSSNKLLIKYRIDDIFLNTYIHKKNNFTNQFSEKITINLYNKKTTTINFKFLKNYAILEANNKKYYFKLSYIDTIPRKSIKNPYYAEDGFDFFKQ